MADPRDILEVAVNGRRFTTWTQASVDCSIEQADRRGTLAIPRQPDDPRPAQFSCPIGSDVEVYARDETTGRRDLILTGSAEGFAPSYDSGSYGITIPLYSGTLSVVLSEALVGPVLQGLTRLGIVRALCAPHGVEVVAGEGVTDSDPIATFKVELGETAYAAIVRVTEPAAWLVTDDASGRLVLTRAGADRAETALILGENILRLGGPGIDGTQRFSEYVCRGQRAGDDQDYGAAVAEVYGAATDAWQTRRRRLSVDPDRQTWPAAAKARAEWEAAQRAGRSVGFVVDVLGFRQSPGGPLWVPNLRVPLQDDWSGLDAELLITGCSYRSGGDGCRTSLTLAPVVGYLPFIPPAAPPRPTRRKGGIFADVSAYMADLAGSASKAAAAAAAARRTP